MILEKQIDMKVHGAKPLEHTLSSIIKPHKDFYMSEKEEADKY